MVIAFTICSNNYLAQAKTMGDSFLDHHPEAKFIIGLVDRFDTSFNYDFFSRFEIIPVEDIQINDFNGLVAKYNIVELNTAVKPSYIHYIFKKHQADKLIYLDPDILVTGHFEELLNVLDTHNIVLTPHICTPVDDEFTPTDYHTLRGGVFNLGFIALSNYTAVIPFINWWHDRVIKYGYGNYTLNMFYDQLWANYIPCFYDNYYILKHPGYNMAPWNLHERTLMPGSTGKYLVNRNYPLKFFHFSSYKFNKPEAISAHVTRYDFEQRNDLRPLFSEYYNLLEKNAIKELSKLPVHYYPHLHKLKKASTKLDRLRWRFKRAAEILVKGK